MDQSQYVIEMENITKAFGTFKANDNINLKVKKGEIHALLGENGAGKSTLMNILSGLLEPTSGAIKINGKEEKISNLIVAGGVAANHKLREEVTQFGKDKNIDVCFPLMKYCTDNATMIAAAGYFAYLDGRRADFSLNGKSSDKLK